MPLISDHTPNTLKVFLCQTSTSIVNAFSHLTTTDVFLRHPLITVRALLPKVVTINVQVSYNVLSKVSRYKRSNQKSVLLPQQLLKVTLSTDNPTMVSFYCLYQFY